jgi:hypothetical protein
MEHEEGSVHTSSIPVDHAVLVSNALVEIELSIDPFTSFVLETSFEHVVVLDTDVFCGEMEVRHFELVVWLKD